MVNRGKIRVAMIVLIASALVSLFAGIMSGLHQDWMRMCGAFCGSVFVIFSCTMCLLALKIDTCFRRLEDLISKKLNFFQSGE